VDFNTRSAPNEVFSLLYPPTVMESFRIRISVSHLPRPISNMWWSRLLYLCNCRITFHVRNIFHWKE